MEGYTNISGGNEDFDDLDIEGRGSGYDDARHQPRMEKDSSDESKRLLEIKVKLEDGGYGYVFSSTNRDSAWRWRCTLCDIIIVGQTHVETHIQSKKHQVKMALPSHDRQLFTRIEGQEVASMEIAPGEPVPPGFEGTVVSKKGVAQIQAILDCHKSSPLIGLEYLVEIVPDERDKEPMYVCVLCDKKGDPRVAMAHLTSFNHRSKYIGINYPTANRAMNSTLPRTREGRRGVSEIVTHICAKIEEKHGRLMPLVLTKEAYEKKKDFYHRQIENDRHFRESPDENYMDLVDQDVLRPYSIDIKEVPLPIAASPLRTPVAETKKEEKDPKRKITVDRSRLRTHASKDNDKKNESAEKKASSDEASPEKKVVLDKATSEKKVSLDKKTSSSDKPKRDKRRNSLSSISSISSSSLSRSPSPARTRSKSRTLSSSPTTSVSRRRGDTKPYDRNSRNRSNRSSRYRGRRSRSRSPRYAGRRPSRSPSRRMSRSRSNSRGRYRNSYKKRSPGKEKPKNPLLEEKSRWETYRSDIGKLERDLLKTLKFHEKNPEKHPMYPEEWKKFWNIRYKEIQSEGKDPSKHDFKPEWIEFWNKRMKEMHEEELKQKKDEVRQKLKLPKDDLKHSNKSFYIPVKKSRPEIDDDIIIISPGPFSSKDTMSKSNWRKGEPKERKRSLSPWDNDDRNKWVNPRPSYSERSRGRGKSTYNPPTIRPLYQTEDENFESESARVITVIRLLTAMESQLGSIGPSVNNLLASALAMEKQRTGASEALLGNPDNLVMFETIKEKLKGQLFAGIVEPGLIMATRSCIQNLAEMLYRADKMPKIAIKAPVLAAPIVAKPLIVKAEPVTVPGVGAMDKAAIATQIAAALVAEGRGNVTQEELESLINAVIGMAQASATLDKPMTTAAFVSQMNPKTEPAVASPPVVPLSVDPKSPLEKLLSVVHSKPIPSETSQTVTCLFPSYAEPPKKDPSPPPPKMNMSDMEELTEFDLKALLQNFKDLSTEEQYCLITYLKKIEAKEPDRVENLRQFVNLPPVHNVIEESEPEKPSHRLSRRLSPFSLRLGRANPTSDESFKRSLAEQEEKMDQKKLRLDDSDDDYSFEDIYVAASKNLSEKDKAVKEAKDLALQEEEAKKLEVVKTESPTQEVAKEDDAENILRQTEMLIANLMGQFPAKFVQKQSSTPSPQVHKPDTPSRVELPSRASASLPEQPIVEQLLRPKVELSGRSSADLSARPNVELPVRSNTGLKIDISNTLIDAEANFPQSAKQSTNEIKSIAQIQASPNTDSNPSITGPLTPVNNLLYDPNFQTQAVPYHEQFGQQAFQGGQFPDNYGSFQNGQGYPQDYARVQGGGGYPNQQFPQGYQGNNYPGNFNGNYYAGQQQQQQQLRPNEPFIQPMGRGYPDPQYQQQRPGGQPPFRQNGPPQGQGYPNQYTQGGQFNQYPNQQGFY